MSIIATHAVVEVNGYESEFGGVLFAGSEQACRVVLEMANLHNVEDDMTRYAVTTIGFDPTASLARFIQWTDGEVKWAEEQREREAQRPWCRFCHQPVWPLRYDGYDNQCNCDESLDTRFDMWMEQRCSS